MWSLNKNLFLLAASVLLLFACDKKQENKNRSPETQKAIENEKIQIPENTISYEEAKGMQQEYLTSRATILNENLRSMGVLRENQQEVRDVTFDLENLKEYIAYVEAEAAKKGLKGVGLRVYFGAYKEANKKVKIPGSATVFFMPTYQVMPKSTDLSKELYPDKGQVIPGVAGFNKGISGYPPNDLK